MTAHDPYERNNPKHDGWVDDLEDRADNLRETGGEQ